MKDITNTTHPLPTPILSVLLTVLLSVFPSALLPLKAQQLAVKTNALYWLTSTPNLSVEATVGRHLSMQITTGYNAWKFSGKHSLKHLLLSPEARYWFSRPMERHYLGVYGQYGTFNLRNIPLLAPDNRAYQGRAYGAGLSYGYQWALGKRFGIEASVGVGYLYLTYSKFLYTDCCAERISDHRRTYIGPTRMALNLIYLIR